MTTRETGRWSSSAPASRSKRPSFRLTCCLCRKPIPLANDVQALDEEWQRRFPEMVGTLACQRCAFELNPWRCQTPAGDYVPGHRPARASAGADMDAWSHVEARGTHLAMVLSYPLAAVQQGAEDYLRWLVAARPHLDPLVAASICDALNWWDHRARGRRVRSAR